jgi:hypothetical protein
VKDRVTGSGGAGIFAIIVCTTLDRLATIAQSSSAARLAADTSIVDENALGPHAAL